MRRYELIVSWLGKIDFENRVHYLKKNNYNLATFARRNCISIFLSAKLNDTKSNGIIRKCVADPPYVKTVKLEKYAYN